MDVVIEGLTQGRTWIGVTRRIDSGDLLLEIQLVYIAIYRDPDHPGQGSGVEPGPTTTQDLEIRA